MNVTESIFARRSVRAYTPRKVEGETLKTLIDAAIQGKLKRLHGGNVIVDDPRSEVPPLAGVVFDRTPHVVYDSRSDVACSLASFFDRTPQWGIDLRDGETRVTQWNGERANETPRVLRTRSQLCKLRR